MASDTKNVKLGVCQIFYDGQDLGYTKGGVEVEVSTDTHKVTVDQFGVSEINEYITKRSLKVKCPLAETTLDNLVSIMPGASLVTDGVKANGAIELSGNAAEGESITINGVEFTFSATPAGLYEIQIGADTAATLTNAVDKLNASTHADVVIADYASNGTHLQVQYGVRGVAGNSFTLATDQVGATVTAMSGGVDATSERVDVSNGIGTDLLTVSKKLRLHPLGKADDDLSEDFIVGHAGTGGALQFAYKYDEERVFNVEFMGYPDPLTKTLFSVGDPNAA